jgi:hypothetical protein
MAARLSVSQVEKALQDYVAHRWSYREFAYQLGISVGHAHRILSGHSFKQAVRPNGFEFPWPEHGAESKLGHLTEAQILEAFDLYQKHLWSVRDFAAHLGIHYRNARALFLGTAHKGLKIPDVPYRTRPDIQKEQIQDWYKKKKEEDRAKLADRLG